jgi:hypothetical protein
VCPKRIKIDVEQALLRVRQQQRVCGRLFSTVKSELEKLERKLERLSREEMIDGTLHEQCSYHGSHCKRKGQKKHPIRYLLRTKEGARHVPQNKLSLVQRRVNNREELQKAFELLKNYILLLSEWEDSFTSISNSLMD